MTEPEFPTRRARRLYTLAQGEPPLDRSAGIAQDVAEPAEQIDETTEGPNELPALSHLRADDSAHMVDVSEKPVTQRRAVAHATVITRADVVHAVIEGTLPKGEAIGTARIAGIMAAKQTSNLIPLCHPLPLTSITVDIAGDLDRLQVVATVATTAVTGVEMEALTAASVAALTLYDMIKAVDKLATITDIRVVEKSGGRSGDWSRP